MEGIVFAESSRGAVACGRSRRRGYSTSDTGVHARNPRPLFRKCPKIFINIAVALILIALGTRVAPLFCDVDTGGNRKLRRGGKSQAPRASRGWISSQRRDKNNRFLARCHESSRRFCLFSAKFNLRATQYGPLIVGENKIFQRTDVRL